VAAASTGEAPPSQPVPTGVREAVHRATGRTVADAPVVRGPEVDRTASDIQARAYTDEATIHLPSSAGPIDAPEARSLLAHELTHVAQQRELGSSRPPEHTGAGQQLEHEARTAEHAVQRAPLVGAAPAVAPPPVIASGPSLPSLPVVREQPVDGTAGSGGHGPHHRDPGHDAGSTPTGAQRATTSAPGRSEVGARTGDRKSGGRPPATAGTPAPPSGPVTLVAPPPLDGPTLAGTLGAPPHPTRRGADRQRAPIGLPDLGRLAPAGPTLPTMPGLGDLPGLPAIADLPATAGIPALRSDHRPDRGGMARSLPDLPGGGTPDLGGMTRGLPDLPGGGVPDLGGMTRGLPELPGLPGIGGVPGLADQVPSPLASVPPAAAPVSAPADQAADRTSGGLAERAGSPAGLPDPGRLADQASGAFGGLAERAGDAVSGPSATAPAGPDTAATDADLEKKIAPLFDKFADRLRNELRHQRERAGRLTDL
jgi:hypothetical protein